MVDVTSTVDDVGVSQVLVVPAPAAGPRLAAGSGESATDCPTHHQPAPQVPPPPPGGGRSSVLHYNYHLFIMNTWIHTKL